MAVQMGAHMKPLFEFLEIPSHSNNPSVVPSVGYMDGSYFIEKFGEHEREDSWDDMFFVSEFRIREKMKTISEDSSDG